MQTVLRCFGKDSAVLGQTEIAEMKKGERMQSVDFHVQMDCEIGVPEFFLGDFL